MLLPKAGLHIIGEYFLPIRFQLMAIKGASLGTIKAARYAHHGHRPVRQMIRKLGLKAIVTADTAGAAREVAEMNDPTQAAISPGSPRGLRPRDPRRGHRGRRPQHHALRHPVAPEDLGGARPGAMTSFVFQVRNVPAALYKAMGGFATNGVNMTKLESHMIDGRFVATQFYAEIEGHPTTGR